MGLLGKERFRSYKKLCMVGSVVVGTNPIARCIWKSRLDIIEPDIRNIRFDALGVRAPKLTEAVIVKHFICTNKCDSSVTRLVDDF